MTEVKKEESKETAKKTDFQGAVSLDAIFAATGAKKEEAKVAAPKEDKEEVSDTKEIPNKVSPDKSTSNKTEEADAPKAEPFKQEVKKEDEGEEKEQKAKKESDDTEESESYRTAQKLISLGLLDDFNIQTSEEDDEGTAISQFKGMTEENLQEIIGIHKQEKDNEISSKYLPKGDLKEHQLKVFEILSNGGDLSQIAETPEKALERPFEGFDMDDQQRQVDVRYTDLVHSKGLDHESAITIIDKEVKSGKLKEKAEDTFSRYRDAHSKYVDDILVKQKKDKEFKDLNFKENKKLLQAKLKESGLKESVYKKVTSEYGKKDENGEYTLITKLREALESPEDNHELILHLTDKDLFEDVFKIKSSQETQKRIVKLASGAASKGNRKSTTTQSPESQAPWLRQAQEYNDNIRNK